MKIVIIESPFAAESATELEDNILYARACMLDALQRGEAPFASHLLYTQVLDDRDPHLRTLGMRAGLEVALRADYTVVYSDRGISEGMRKGIKHAHMNRRPIFNRWLGSDWRARLPGVEDLAWVG